MVVFPLISAVISLACTIAIARDAVRRPRPDKIAWAISFALFTIGAAAEVIGDLNGWTPLLARVYYLSGAVLVVGFLAVGELYLLAPKRVEKIAPGATLLVSALAVTLVWGAPVDAAKLATDGYDALERGVGLRSLAVAINSLGTLVIVAGLIYSAVKFRRLGTMRNRMIGCVLIAAGTFVVALGGSLTGLGHHEYLYISMAIGVAIIFAGYLWTKRPDAGEQPVTEQLPVTKPALVALPVERGRTSRRPAADPAIAFLEERFLPLSGDALAEACRQWSVGRSDADAFSRDEARAAWSLRLRLSPAGQAMFDAHAIPAQRQLAELYHEVLVQAGEAAAN